MTEATAPVFSIGTLLSTSGALAAFRRNGQSPLELLQRHIAKDWGDMDAEDRQANEQALLHGSRLLSVYHLNDGTKIWVITEAVGEAGHREATTFLLPSEY